MRLPEHIRVGDPIMWCSVNHKSRAAIVRRIGRKYIYVDCDHDRSGYDRTTGRKNDNYGHDYLMTVDEHYRIQSVSKARSELRDFGVNFDYVVSGDRILAVYQALKSLMEKHEEA